MRNGLNFSLIGDEVSYSKSPAIFSAIFKSIGREGHYDIARVNGNSLRSSLNQLVLEGNRGFSVTIPYKQSILECLDDIDPVAQKVGAVNCVSVNESHLHGYNTDCYGFAYSFLSVGKKSIGETALIAGSGGSARAVAYSLYSDFGIRRLTLLGRTMERLEECRKSLQLHFEKLEINTMQAGTTEALLSQRYDIVINCTPLGGWRHSESSPFEENIPCAPGGIYYDLNYNQSNRLVARAREQGLTALDGAPMLVAQAIRSFDIWTGIQVRFDDIFPSVFGGGNGTSADRK